MTMFRTQSLEDSFKGNEKFKSQKVKNVTITGSHSETTTPGQELIFGTDPTEALSRELQGCHTTLSYSQSNFKQNQFETI
jgi:hypothetical protein